VRPPKKERKAPSKVEPENKIKIAGSKIEPMLLKRRQRVKEEKRR